MGKWRGTAPLSHRGNWTHAPVLQLQYNNRSKFKKAKLNEQDIVMVGKAYDMAIIMLQTAIDTTDNTDFGLEYSLNKYDQFSDTNKGVLKEYFGVNPEINQIKVTLLCTLQGLRDNSQQNRIHLFRQNMQNNSKDLGYVSNASPTYQEKAHRPQVLSHDPANPQAGVKIPRARGHIHINLNVKSIEDLATTIVHEGTHRFTGTGDFAYYSEGQKFRNLTAAEQLNNADSYAMYCKVIYMSKFGWK